MNNEQKFWVTIWSILSVACVTFGVSFKILSDSHVENMSALGFQKTMVVGNDYSIWQKVKANEGEK